MKLPEGAVVAVMDAQLVPPYRISIAFSDGHQNVVDFRPFLEGSRHPLIRAYLEPEKFAGFSVRDGDLVWGDYDLCFPVGDLYEGTL